MARKKRGLIFDLKDALKKLNRKREDKIVEAIKSLNSRLSRLEELLLGSSEPAQLKIRRRRKVGKRARKKPAEKIVKTCTVSGCKQKHYAKGLCAFHYHKARREKEKA